MYRVLLGVVKQLWKMWIDQKCPIIHLTTCQQKEINKRLLNITITPERVFIVHQEV